MTSMALMQSGQSYYEQLTNMVNKTLTVSCAVKAQPSYFKQDGSFSLNVIHKSNIRDFYAIFNTVYLHLKLI